MDHLNSIAATYYIASSTETQKRVGDFIKALDKNENGEVDIFEFKQCLKEEGFKDYADSNLFKKLDKSGEKGLDYWEVMTLYYIIMSGRPFCSACGDFIMAEYFVCVECFEKSNAPIYLCPSCYQKGNNKHSHSNKNALFLDNYAMLESQRLSALTKKGQAEESPSNAMVTYTPSSSNSPSSASLAIVSSRITPGRVTTAAVKTFETALGLANLKVGLLSLGISACTIM